MQCPTCLVKYRLCQNSSLPSFLSVDGFNDGSRRAIDVFLFHFNPIVSTKFIYSDYLFILYHSGNFFYYYHFNQHFNAWKNWRELALYQKKVKFEKFTTFSLLQPVHILNFTLQSIFLCFYILKSYTLWWNNSHSWCLVNNMFTQLFLTAELVITSSYFC